MNDAPMSTTEATIAVVQASTGRSSPFGMSRSFVRGFLASILASMALLNDMPAVLAAVRAIITQIHIFSDPPPANSTPINAKGRAKSVCSIIISLENLLKSIFFPPAAYLFLYFFRHLDLIRPFAPHPLF